MSFTTRKMLDGATKIGLQILAKNAPLLGMRAIGHWNQLILRGEHERARADIRREFNQNREIARAILQKYAGDMQPEVRSIFEEMMAGGGDEE